MIKLIHRGIAVLTVGLFVTLQFGCGGGSQEPAESPAPATTTEAPAGESAPPESGEGSGGGEHTMPDGSKMSGDHDDTSTPPAAEDPKK